MSTTTTTTTTTTSAAAVHGGAHILLFPVPTAGHIIPMIDLAHKLLTRGLTLTILVPPKDLPLLQPLISDHPSLVHPLVLAAPDPPPTSPPTLVARIRALSELYNPILHWFQSHPSPPTLIVSDFLLSWTHHLACQLSIQRVMFSPSGSFGFSIVDSTWRTSPKNDDPNDDQNFLFTFDDIPNSPTYPWWQLPIFYRIGKEGDPDWEFLRSLILANMMSWGSVYNSFTELERVYLDYTKKLMGHDRVWAVGPLLPLDDDSMGSTERGGSSCQTGHEVMTWLDKQPVESVVYVCFGSRAKLTREQMDVLAGALEGSGVRFILCARDMELASEFEERVGERGFVITGWAPQVAILRHQAVKVFVTHCGWNSTMEGIASGILMLTWPMGADQFTNEKLLVDQVCIGKRTFGSGSNVPNITELTQLLKESIEGFSNEKSRAMKLRGAALDAIKGGSSSRELDDFVKQVTQTRASATLVFLFDMHIIISLHH